MPIEIVFILLAYCIGAGMGFWGADFLITSKVRGERDELRDALRKARRNIATTEGLLRSVINDYEQADGHVTRLQAELDENRVTRADYEDYRDRAEKLRDDLRGDIKGLQGLTSLRDGQLDELEAANKRGLDRLIEVVEQRDSLKTELAVFKEAARRGNIR